MYARLQLLGTRFLPVSVLTGFRTSKMILHVQLSWINTEPPRRSQLLFCIKYAGFLWMKQYSFKISVYIKGTWLFEVLINKNGRDKCVGEKLVCLYLILIFLFKARIGTSYPHKTPIIRCSSKRTPTINKEYTY